MSLSKEGERDWCFREFESFKQFTRDGESLHVQSASFLEIVNSLRDFAELAQIFMMDRIKTNDTEMAWSLLQYMVHGCLKFGFGPHILLARSMSNYVLREEIERATERVPATTQPVSSRLSPMLPPSGPPTPGSIEVPAEDSVNAWLVNVSSQRTESLPQIDIQPDKQPLNSHRVRIEMPTVSNHRRTAMRSDRNQSKAPRHIDDKSQIVPHREKRHAKMNSSVATGPRDMRQRVHKRQQQSNDTNRRTIQTRSGHGKLLLGL